MVEVGEIAVGTNWVGVGEDARVGWAIVAVGRRGAGVVGKIDGTGEGTPAFTNVAGFS